MWLCQPVACGATRKPPAVLHLRASVLLALVVGVTGFAVASLTEGLEVLATLGHGFSSLDQGVGLGIIGCLVALGSLLSGHVLETIVELRGVSVSAFASADLLEEAVVTFHGRLHDVLDGGCGRAEGSGADESNGNDGEDESGFHAVIYAEFV